MYTYIYELFIRHNEEANNIYQYAKIYVDVYTRINCIHVLRHRSYNVIYEYIYNGKYYYCERLDESIHYIETNYGDPDLSEKIFLDGIINISINCRKNELDILNEILYITEFKSLKYISITSDLISDYFVDFLIHKKNIDKLKIIIRIEFIITKKFIDMLLYKDFEQFTLLDINYKYNKPKLIIKDILKNKNKFIICDDVLSYIKDIVYDYYDISFFQLSHNVKRLANDFVQEKIE